MPRLTVEITPTELTEIVIGYLRGRTDFPIKPEHLKFVEYRENIDTAKIGAQYQDPHSSEE